MRKHLISWIWTDGEGPGTYIAVTEMEDEQAQFVRDRLIAVEQYGEIISSSVEVLDEFRPVSFTELNNELTALFGDPDLESPCAGCGNSPQTCTCEVPHGA